MHKAARKKGAPSARFFGHIQPEGYNDIFLDESLKNAAAAIVDRHLEIGAGYDLRLSGLLCDDSAESGNLRLGLVFISRLRQPGVIDRSKGEAGICFYGIGDMRQNRERFNTWSRILIDHLDAF
jgi:predicted NUDIX family phosphoesterase